MAKSDPFGFDISVSASKKRRNRSRRGQSGAFETSQRRCEHPGCTERGLYRAPKSPDRLDEYYWFCRTHVREYNRRWNYFDGAEDAGVNDQRERDRIWDRETKPFTRRARTEGWEHLGIDDPHQILGDKGTRQPDAGTTTGRRLPPMERRALDILDAREGWTKTEIRKQYRSLIKDLHPDMNGGARADEERLQEVVWAWEQIRESRSFPE